MKFHTLTKQNAKAFFELYMSRKDKVLAEFKARSEATGGPKVSELDYSEQSLIPLWLWVRDRTPHASEHPPLDLLPPWYEFELITNPHSRTICFTPEAAHNLDGLSYYWGEVLLRNIPDTKWSIYPYRGEIYYCKPAVNSEFFSNYPLGMNIVRASIYNEDHNERRVTSDSLVRALQACRDQDISYREYYRSNGNKHDASHIKCLVNFD